LQKGILYHMPLPLPVDRSPQPVGYLHATALNFDHNGTLHRVQCDKVRLAIALSTGSLALPTYGVKDPPRVVEQRKRFVDRSFRIWRGIRKAARVEFRHPRSLSGRKPITCIAKGCAGRCVTDRQGAVSLRNRLSAL
jgi:hypothetical protein